jgi:hypothetical protein
MSSMGTCLMAWRFRSSKSTILPSLPQRERQKRLKQLNRHGYRTELRQRGVHRWQMVAHRRHQIQEVRMRQRLDLMAHHNKSHISNRRRTKVQDDRKQYRPSCEAHKPQFSTSPPPDRTSRGHGCPLPRSTFTLLLNQQTSVTKRHRASPSAPHLPNQTKFLRTRQQTLRKSDQPASSHPAPPSWFRPLSPPLV